MRPYGPKPSLLFIRASKDPLLFWIYRNAGARGVQHFVEARLRIETDPKRIDLLLKVRSSARSWLRKYRPRTPKPRRDGPIQGPRPSVFMRHCLQDPQLTWIVQTSGIEAVVDYALERAELGHCITAQQRWMRLARCGIRHQEELEKQRQQI